MKKNLLKPVLALLLLLLIIFLLFRNSSPFGRNNTSFAISPGEEITRIELTEGSKRLSIEKIEDKWFLNGKTEVRKSSVLYVMRILNGMQIKSPVSPELFEKEVNNSGVGPVKVKVFKRHKLLKSFLVYRTNSNVYGNIMKMRVSSKPFVVYLPGSDRSIGSAFNINELSWLPYTVFNLLPSEIEAVFFEAADSSDAFSIKKHGRDYILLHGKNTIRSSDTGLVKRYLSYFTWIPFEQWAFDISKDEKKKIETQQPSYRIIVVKTDGSKIELTLWQKEIERNGLLKTDTDRLYGKTAASDELFIIRYLDVDPILKKLSYFVRE
jgi:hypothetical protein